MKTEKNKMPKEISELRRRADRKAAHSPEIIDAMLPEEVKRLLHELRVHQIELEMQNEELRTSHAELASAQTRYSALYNLAPTGYCTVSGKGLILKANLAAATLLGEDRDALVNQPIFRFIFRENQDIYYLHRKKLFETCQLQEFDLRMLKKDGTAFWAHLVATVIQDDCGCPQSCHIILNDITERKKAEEEKLKLESLFRQSQKMEAVGQLAGGISHDFNNPLSVISGYSYLLLMNSGLPDRTKHQIEAINSAVERAAGLTRQLLLFSRLQPLESKIIALDTVISGIGKMLRRLIKTEEHCPLKPGMSKLTEPTAFAITRTSSRVFT
jgi:two-component system cell cycle sensor histidine kinase/response regulator CckA